MPLAYSPIFNAEWQTAKRILCAIIQEAGGKLEGEVRLNKAFYWSHLAYWKKHQGILTGYPMARMPNGPGIDRGEDLLFDLQTEGLLKISERKISGAARPEKIFELKAGFIVNMTDAERDAIHSGLKKITGKTGTRASKETHSSSHSWQRMRNGQILNIYEDLLTPEQFDKMDAADSEAKSALDAVFG